MDKKTIEVKQIDWYDDHFYKIRYENEAKVEVEDYIPSVTTKLGALAKPFLLHWYGTLGEREAKLRMVESADRGSRIHWAWQAFTTRGIVIYDPPKTPIYTREEIDEMYKRFNGNAFVIRDQEEMYQVMKLQAFYNEIKPVQSMSERIVYDIDNRDAGTMDNLFLIKEGEYKINGAKPVKLEEGSYVFDLKTGNVIGKEARMQVACYAYCAFKMGIADNIKGAIIGHTSSKNKSGIEGFGTTVLTKKELEPEYNDYRDISRVWERNFGNRKPTIRQIPGFITTEKI